MRLNKEKQNGRVIKSSIYKKQIKIDIRNTYNERSIKMSNLQEIPAKNGSSEADIWEEIEIKDRTFGRKSAARRERLEA